MTLWYTMRATLETWRPCAQNSRYEVSSAGRVRVAQPGKASRRGQLVGIRKHKRYGYAYVDLWEGGKSRRFYVHGLILSAFVGPKPAGQEGCHKNGIRTDNRLSNLKWGTRSENVKDAQQHGTYTNGFAIAWARGSFTKEKILARNRKAGNTRRASRELRSNGKQRVQP